MKPVFELPLTLEVGREDEGRLSEPLPELVMLGRESELILVLLGRETEPRS